MSFVDDYLQFSIRSRIYGICIAVATFIFFLITPKWGHYLLLAELSSFLWLPPLLLIYIVVSFIRAFCEPNTAITGPPDDVKEYLARKTAEATSSSASHARTGASASRSRGPGVIHARIRCMEQAGRSR